MKTNSLMSYARKLTYRMSPNLFWQPYARKARQSGLERLYLILSFDCDTPEDAEAAQIIHVWLRERNLNATYAVPGEQLQQGAETYKKLAGEGAFFINHGALPHTEYRDGRYWSITYYHQMQPAEVVADIHRGHEILLDVIGEQPRGFRAPHFGHFQKPEQLELIYDLLRELGYRYATTTVPAFSQRLGPIADSGDLYEIPVSGTYFSPLRILDSWNHLEDYSSPRLRDSYAALFMQTVKQLLAADIPGVLNYYVDPAHVYRSPSFFHAIEYAMSQNVPVITYNELLDLVEL